MPTLEHRLVLIRRISDNLDIGIKGANNERTGYMVGSLHPEQEEAVIVGKRRLVPVRGCALPSLVERKRAESPYKIPAIVKTMILILSILIPACFARTWFSPSLNGSLMLEAGRSVLIPLQGRIRAAGTIFLIKV